MPQVRTTVARVGGGGGDEAAGAENTTQGGSPNGPAKKLARNISNKWSSFRARTASGLILGAGGLIVLFHGAMSTMVMIFAVQTLMTKELFDLSESQEKAKLESAGIRFRLQKWYFYFCAAFTLYGRMGRHFYLTSLAEKGHFFMDETTTFAKVVTWVMLHHSFISYSLYMGGFVAFVLLLLTNKVALSATSFSIGEKRECADEAILIAPLLETFLALKFSTRDRDPRTADDEDVNANIIVLFLLKFFDWLCVCVCVCVFLVDRSDDQLNNYSNWTFQKYLLSPFLSTNHQMRENT